MNIAVFADVHGRVLLAFLLCARWQRETGERIDLILQAGDMGTFPNADALDKATKRHAEADPTELGFATDFASYSEDVAARLAETACPLIYVRGNHEDHRWLDERERQEREAPGEHHPLVSVDAYQRIWLLPTGEKYTFRSKNTGESITILGVGRIGGPTQAQETERSQQRRLTYIQPAEEERIYALEHPVCDVLLTHDCGRDDLLPGSGIEEIRLLLNQARPGYHFFGHYGGPCLLRTDANGVTTVCKLADLHWDRAERGLPLMAGSMGLLRWRDKERHMFEVVDAPWLREYTAHSWRYV